MTEENREQPEEAQNSANEASPPDGQGAPENGMFEIILVLTGVTIWPDMVERVTWTLSPSTADWETWEFELYNPDGSLHSQWSRPAEVSMVAGEQGQAAGATDPYTGHYHEDGLPIDPPLNLVGQNYSFRMRAITKFGAQSSWESVDVNMPAAPSAVTTKYDPDSNLLYLKWEWTDSLKPAGTEVWFYARCHAEFGWYGQQREAYFSLPATDNSSQYLLWMKTKFEYEKGPTQVTSFSAWVPPDGIEIIVAAPEELLAEYNQDTGTVDFTWTQPTPYGVSGYDIQYSVDGGTPAQTSVSGAENTQLSVPASEIPGFDPDQETPLSGQVRATGQNGATYVDLGPWSASTDLLYPDKGQLIITSISGTVDEHNHVVVTDEWLEYPGATAYWVYCDMNNFDPQHVVYGETTSGSITYTTHKYNPNNEYKTTVIAHDDKGVAAEYTWIPIILDVPQNIAFLYLYEPETNEIYLQTTWDAIPGATSSTLYDIEYTVSGKDPIVLTTEPGQTEYNSEQPAEAGVTYTIRIRARDIYTVYGKEPYKVQRFGPWSDSVTAGTDSLLSRTYVFDAAGRLRSATTGKRTNVYSFDARDNLIEVKVENS